MTNGCGKHKQTEKNQTRLQREGERQQKPKRHTDGKKDANQHNETSG